MNAALRPVLRRSIDKLMGKGWALRFVENKVVGRHLRGRGVEIGALSRAFPLPRGARVWHIDRCDQAALRWQYPEVRELITPEILADAAQLPFARESLDFVIASHVLEHLLFPLRALANWYSVLRPGGVLLLKVPDKRYTFDALRARTTLEHLLTEHLTPEKFDRRSHFEDWVQHIGGYEPGSQALQVQADQLMDADYSIHYHVWTDDDVLELIRHTRAAMGMKWTEVLFLRAHFYRKECAAVLRRGESVSV